jgi:D-alanyl-D-alanine carboxypeptidase/D-alanyl-D-alanine-endopeptidase (penicillin-binding protein 4)
VLLAVLAAVLVLAPAAAGVIVVQPGPVAGWLGQEPAVSTPPAPTPEPSPPPVLVAAAEPIAPTPAGVRAAIDRLVIGARLGGRLSVSVTDVATGQSLYARGPDVSAIPASTTKLVTAVAALAARGPVHRIPTRVVAGDRPGEVVLVGGGDPTLSVAGRGTYPGAARLDQLAAQVTKALGGAAVTGVVVDSSLFSGGIYGPGWDADIPTGGFAGPVTALMTDGGRINPRQLAPAERHPAPDLAAGRAFARQLRLPAAVVSAVRRGPAPPDAGAPGTPASGATGDAPAAGTEPPLPGTELARVESPPLLRLVEFMLADSDNIVAEALARQVALARDRPASYAGAAAAVDGMLTELGLPAQESALADGSGLSRNNRLTPSALTDVLAYAAGGDRPELAGVFSGLPVAGWSGTLADRFRAVSGTGTAGLGVVRAKTGTLSGVDAMAGVVLTADGRMLAFALLADGVTAGHLDAQAALDAIAAALARCGCR